MTGNNSVGWIKKNLIQIIQTVLLLALVCTIAWLASGVQRVAGELDYAGRKLSDIQRTLSYMNSDVDLSGIELELSNIAVWTRGISEQIMFKD